MLFYHYSNKEYKELKSLFARGMEKEGYESDDNDPRGYKKNISLFLEPIPRDVAKLMNNEHVFWKSGLVLYEHVIDASSLPKDVLFKITGTRSVTDLLYYKQDWDKVPGNPTLKEKYQKEIRKVVEKEEHISSGRDKLIKVVNSLSFDIREDYKHMYALHKKHPEDSLMVKYAACVTHVMIYPALTPIKVSSSFQITLK